MAKFKYTDFELTADIIKKMNIACDNSKMQKIEYLNECWIDVVNESLYKQTKICDILEDNSVKISCKDSYIANELYLEKDNILKQLKNKLGEKGITITNIKFDYKKWEE